MFLMIFLVYYNKNFHQLKSIRKARWPVNGKMGHWEMEHGKMGKKRDPALQSSLGRVSLKTGRPGMNNRGNRGEGF
jgi:hypothetical protein